MKLNPADIATRITNPIKPVNNSLWWNRSKFLTDEQLEILNQENFATVEKHKVTLKNKMML